MAVFAQAMLAPRERQVLELLAAALPTTVIGGKLGLASKTINNHASTILANLQVADRTEAVLRARDAGYGGSPSSFT
jgi:DNA-binding NarL/FixJ family response regulator